MQKLNDIAKGAPSEIADDMKTVSDGYDKLTKAIAQNDTAAAEDIDQDKLEAAGERIDKFVKEKCGIEMS